LNRYTRILAVEPANAASLNNLAYALAVHKASPQEALPFAQKAYALSKDNPLVADTLGWIHHLLGQDDEASAFLTEALKGAPNNAEVHLHAAIVSLSLDRRTDAGSHLKQAVSLDPAMATRSAVITLQKELEDH
jgi:Flp pilus assembly protein TadD